MKLSIPDVIIIALLFGTGHWICALVVFALLVR